MTQEHADPLALLLDRIGSAGQSATLPVAVPEIQGKDPIDALRPLVSHNRLDLSDEESTFPGPALRSLHTAAQSLGSLDASARRKAAASIRRAIRELETAVALLEGSS